MLEHRIPPPVVGACVAVGMWGLARIGEPSAGAPAWRWALVAVLVATGLAFDLSGLLAFRAARTTFNPLKPDRASALVTQGVYQITRNPMYVGMACLLLGWAAFLWRLWPLAGPLVFVLYITHFQIRPEERVLHGLFGRAFSDYTARVRRWL